MRRSPLASFLLLLTTATACVEAPPPTAGPPAAATAPVGVASFNMAWAGSMQDFDRYLAVCGAPEVSWCDTRARWTRGTTTATPEEQARATKCQEAIFAAAGGRAASALLAPCGAYRAKAPGDPAVSRTREAYAEKLAGLEATVARLIEREGVSVLAFQELRSKDVVETVLGRHAARFDVCVAPHSSFQTVAFAWDKAITTTPGRCAVNEALAVKDPPDSAEAFRQVRPGLALELTVRGAPVTFLNVHLKSGCANIVPTERYPARLLTDELEACEVFNRQVPILETWLESVAKRTPRFVFLGDLNRRIEEEAAAAIAKGEVRADGSDPAGPNSVDARGRVTTKYLWPEIADGTPVMHQVPLAGTEAGCTGFSGLDHVVISDALRALNPDPIPSRKVAVEEKPGQRIQSSDHCPWVVQLRL